LRQRSSAANNALSKALPDAYARARRRVRSLRRFYKHLAVFGLINGVWLLFYLFAPASRVRTVWPFWPFGFWAFGLLIHGLAVWGGPWWLGREWEERKIAELLAREKIRVLSTEKQLAEAQLRMLQAQIEPHFLFNTLANVVSLIETSPGKASAMLENFIAYLRATLLASRATEGTVGQEAGLLRNYLELLKIRMGDRLTYTIDVQPQLLAQSMAPMLLQPIVENAIKHGLEPKIEGGEIRVQIEQHGDRLHARVSDNGLGFRPGANAGVGLQNLRERLAVLYDGQAKLMIEELTPGTRVVIDLPLMR
jgi:two-component sensor histidine kinase